MSTIHPCHDWRYTATDEIRYLWFQARLNPASCTRLCRLYLRDERRWDGSVDVAAVKAACMEILRGLVPPGYCAYCGAEIAGTKLVPHAHPAVLAADGSSWHAYMPKRHRLDYHAAQMRVENEARYGGLRRAAAAARARKAKPALDSRACGAHSSGGQSS
jgi:hypothetical protein